MSGLRDDPEINALMQCGLGWDRTKTNRFRVEINYVGLDLAIRPIPALAGEQAVKEQLGKFRYLGCSPTEEQRELARSSDLYRHGDMVLVWVNEGDLCMHEIVPAIMPELGKMKDQLAAANAEIESWKRHAGYLDGRRQFWQKEAEDKHRLLATMYEALRGVDGQFSKVGKQPSWRRKVQKAIAAYEAQMKGEG